MDQIHHIRALFYEQGKTISDIAAATGRNWKTVAKYVDMKDFNQPKPSNEPKQLCPKLDPYKSTINGLSKIRSIPENKDTQRNGYSNA